MRPLLVLVLSSSAALLADVAPSCGRRSSRPDVQTVGPGDACGGPSRCATGTCLQVGRADDPESSAKMVAHLCTTACADDAACTTFAPGRDLVCAGRAVGGAPVEAGSRVCVSRAALAGKAAP